MHFTRVHWIIFSSKKRLLGCDSLGLLSIFLYKLGYKATTVTIDRHQARILEVSVLCFCGMQKDEVTNDMRVIVQNLSSYFWDTPLALHRHLSASRHATPNDMLNVLEFCPLAE